MRLASDRLREWAEGVLAAHVLDPLSREMMGEDACAQCYDMSSPPRWSFPCDARRGALMVLGALAAVEGEHDKIEKWVHEAMVSHLPPDTGEER